MSPLPRSRIRRRSHVVAAQPGGRGGLRRRAATAFFSLLLLPSLRAHTYIGPTPCRSSRSFSASLQGKKLPAIRARVGYSTFNHLLFDMVALSTTFLSGLTVAESRLTFKICPGSVIDLDDSSLPLGVLPIRVPGVTLQCGDDGRRGALPGGADGCVVRGGGRRDPRAPDWNTDPAGAIRPGAAGVVGGGVAQVYVHGETAYEVTLRGLTFDNALSEEERAWYAARVDAGMAAGPGESGAGGDPQPAQRFAAVAVRGAGFGDDAGPRLITIEDCRFASHRGYALLVSPGIRRPLVPATPAVDLQPFPTAPAVGAPAHPQSSGQLYRKDDGVDAGQGRMLDLLADGRQHIDRDGLLTRGDQTLGAAGTDYLDGRRVHVAGTEFVDNRAAGDSVAGLVTSAYSLTLTNCLFSKNEAKAMVFVYNNDAIVDNTIFSDNKVEVSTVVMTSPEGAQPIVATTVHGEVAAVKPTHIVERTCFLGARVGMSNVLVTDVETAGFAQRDNHATGTAFTWDSVCEGGAAEKHGHACLGTGRCDGTCVQFTSERCAADRMHSREYDMLFNAGRRDAVVARACWGTALGLAAVLGGLLG